MMAADMLRFIIACVCTVILLGVVIVSKGSVPKKGHLLKEKAIQAGCVVDGILESSRMVPPGWDDYNHRFDKAYYRTLYSYQVNGRKYKYRLSLEYNPADKITVYYDPAKPKRAVTDIDIEWKMGAKYRIWALLPLLMFFVIYMGLKCVL